MNILFSRRASAAFLQIIVSTFLIGSVCGQSAEPDVRPLPPNQTYEREIIGKQTHRYKFDLKREEFFQVRVEQKGVDVSLKLLDANGRVLAEMDSPNGTSGFETLSFVAGKDADFVLETVSPNEKAEKGAYVIKRESSRAATAQDKRRVEIEKIFVEGIKARDTEGQAEIGIAKLEKVLKGWQELEDSYLTDLTAKSLVELKENKYFATFNKLFQELNTANTLLKEGETLVYKSVNDSLAGRVKLLEALSTYRNLKVKVYDKVFIKNITAAAQESQTPLRLLTNLQYYSRTFEVFCLDRIARTHYSLSEWKEYIDYTKQVFDCYQEIIADKNIAPVITPERLFTMKFLSAQALRQIGSSLDGYFGKTDEGLIYLEKALEYSQNSFRETRTLQVKLSEAGILRTIAYIYGKQSRNVLKAIEFFTKSLEIYRTIPNQREKEADISSMIASQYTGSFQYKLAIENFENSLKIYRETDNKFGQVNTLQMLGVMYSILNNKVESGRYLNESLQILQSPDFAQNYHKSFAQDTNSYEGFEVYRELNAAFIEYSRLGSIGLAYKYLEDYPKALDYYQKTLEAARIRKESRDIRSSLIGVAFTLGKLERWSDSSNYYLQALEISRATEDSEAIAKDLQDLGWTSLEAEKPNEALKYQNEALVLYQLVGVDESNAFTPSYSALLNEISRTHYALGNKRLAILYGKRAVNAMQGERQRLQNLDLLSQKGFLEKKEKNYRRLADWLIAEGRIIEAEQVLAMLKQEEVLSYLRRDVSEAGKLSQRADLTKDEAAALARYNEIGDKIAALGAEFGKLQELRKNKIELTAAQKKRYDELSKQIRDANNIFQAFLKQLADEFARRPNTKNDLQENLALKSDLKKWGAGVVFLYTLVGENRYRVILTTANAQTDGKTEITEAELNQKISDFRAAVQNPRVDPRPLGKELYDILIKPVEKQLDGAGAKTLLWSLDGNLRLLPFAALWDGERYFGQKYQNVIVTLASRTRLSETVAPDWRVLGLGVSQSKTVREPNGTRDLKFDALPAVRKELDSIVRNEESPGGVLPGRILLDTTFVETELKRELLNGYKVVHIASHFSLNAGDATKSFLLMGDGTALTLNEIKTNEEFSFDDVELLTLSACQTAVVEKDGTGKEIEGFGYVAQQKGAKAILATLWSVADESTQLLMSEFYRLRKENPNMTKAAAMQAAQRAMIAGKLKSNGKTAGCRSEIVKLDGTKETAYNCAANEPFAHPYFWSPFVLIGNWR